MAKVIKAVDEVDEAVAELVASVVKVNESVAEVVAAVVDVVEAVAEFVLAVVEVVELLAVLDVVVTDCPVGGEIAKAMGVEFVPLDFDLGLEIGGDELEGWKMELQWFGVLPKFVEFYFLDSDHQIDGPELSGVICDCDE